MQPFRIALCQVRAYDIEQAEQNLEELLAALDGAGAQGAQLVALPECAYPAYYVRDADPYAQRGVRPYAEVVELFAQKAKRYGYWLAVGMAVPHAGGRLTNSGVVISPEGELMGRYDKSFLWHFDNNWFERGRSFPVFDTGFCRFGVLVCADGRQPEVARMLAVGGAEVILDLTAWVSWGRTTAELTTTQCQYLVPVRAFENGVWIAAADKWGTEDGTIVYAGRSSVFDPLGETRLCGPSDAGGVLTYDMEPMAAAVVPRRPALYEALAWPTADIPALRLEGEPLVPAASGWRLAVVPSEGAFEGAAVGARYASLRAQDADTVVFAGLAAGDGWEEELATLEAAVRARGGTVVAGFDLNGGGAKRQFAAVVTPAGVALHQATHGRGLQPGESNAALVPTPAGNVGVLCGDEGFVPEVARTLALEGADILAWTAFAPHPMLERVARARADENRVYCGVAWPGGGLVASPEGSVLTAVPAGSGVAMTAGGNTMLSRWKDRAPRTHVLRDRVPGAYGPLTR